MKRLQSLLFAMLIAFASNAQVSIERTFTENQQDPISVDSKTPRFTWVISSMQPNALQTAYEINVFNGKKKVWASGKQQSEQSVLIDYQGTPLESDTKYTWQLKVWDNHGNVSAIKTSSFSTGFYAASDWKAKWIGITAAEDAADRPVQYYRNEITVKKKIASARAYITSQGLYEASINGKKIGDAFLTPGWTSYKKRLQYQVYDVTSMLNTGTNALGVMLGNGWFRGTLAWEGNANLFGNKLALLMQIQVTYSDGTKDVFISDENWKSSYGSIISSEIYNGETIDARKEQVGWNNIHFNASSWSPVGISNIGFNHLLATYNEPIRKQSTFKPIKVFVTPKGEQVIDFGQNLVGWVKVKAAGKAGDAITIKHAEVLDKYGNFYTENMRRAKTTAQYSLKGVGIEEFEPHFTFFGFRYIKVEGYPGKIDPENFVAISMNSDMEQTGTFTTSNPLINQLQHNIEWGQRGNFLDVPTDCPQRDERLGWTGDAQVFSRTAAYNFRAHNFFAKWLHDVEADQLENGAIPHVIPNVLGKGNVASAGWADVANIIPWNMYVLYGDKKILADQYNSMKAWVGYMETTSKKDLWNSGAHFGDWLFFRPFDDNDGRSAVTDKYLIAQCFYAHSTQLLINAAEVLGKKEDVAFYSERLKKIKAAFLNEYVTPSGRMISGTQTAYVLALNFDMLPEAMRATVANALVDNIKSYGTHLTTGFLGTPYLCEVLTRYGKTDVSYKLLMREKFPSWLYPVKMGATTIWERWSGMRPDSTFEPAGMNSFNHYAYGAIGDWMYTRVAGINNAAGSIGYKKIEVKPYIGGGLTHAAASLKTYYGNVSSSWKLENGGLIFDVEIPVNTTAIIHVPSDKTLTVNGAAVSTSKDVKLVGVKDGYTTVEVGSGTYQFRQ